MSVNHFISKDGEQLSRPLMEQKDGEPRKTEAMIAGVDRAASQMEDLQSADSLGRVAGGPSLGLLVAPSTHCIHFLPVSKLRYHDDGGDDDHHPASSLMFLSISA